MTQASGSAAEELVNVYLLTKLTSAEEDSFRHDLTADDDLYLEDIKPRFMQWQQDREGNVKDMYRIWRETGGQGEGIKYHTAFFADRESIDTKTIIITRPDRYTMLHSSDANGWAKANYSSYLNAKAYPDGIEPWGAPQGDYDGFLEEIEDYVLRRGLTYGRTKASDFRSDRLVLSLGEGDLSDIVNLSGGKVELVENEEFDLDECMKKLDEVIANYRASGGEVE